MSDSENQEKKSKKFIGRREFMNIAVGSTAAIAGVGAVVQKSQSNTQNDSGTYHEKLTTPVVAQYQVVVAGGGPSGLIAAIAAARSGASTLLIERYPFLGGNGTAGLMTCYNGFRNQRPPEALQTVKGIPAEYIAELDRLGGITPDDPYPKASYEIASGTLPYSIGFDHEAAKIAAFNMIKKEGVALYLHSWVCAPMMENEKVTGVIIESKSGRQAISADIVIDATGDGDVAARAGAPFMLPSKVGDRMKMTLMYRLGGVPANVKDQFRGIHIADRVVQWGPKFDGSGIDVSDLTNAEVQTRLELWEKVNNIRKEPGKESIYLMQTPTGIGVRETRRIIGEHIVTEQDAMKGTRFPDVIAISSNPMPKYHGKRFFFDHEGFDIPYRSLIPQKIENLVLTGRCISSEQAPFQSARSMAPAMAIGHASGSAAALAAIHNVSPRDLDVKELQNLLIKQNAELRI